MYLIGRGKEETKRVGLSVVVSAPAECRAWHLRVYISVGNLYIYIYINEGTAGWNSMRKKK